LDTGQVPASVRDYLTKMQLHGNSYGKPEKKRASWSEGMDVEEFSDQEYLFFADDVSAYDDRGRELIRSVAALLRKAGVSYGILTQGINSDGNDVKAMGETLLFEDLAGKNIRTFNQKGVQKIITLSPHSFHAFKNDYSDLGGSYQVFHYTQTLAFAVDKLKLSENAPKLPITFHDPCYLGRHNWDYESPRTVLRGVPGVQLIEMDRNRKDALCCGGGGGNFFTDMLSGGNDTPARARVREAKNTGAQVLAVACPQCAIMFEDAIKSENLETSLQVKEISEVIAECIEW
jgi:Fe-S oxidoreductase